MKLMPSQEELVETILQSLKQLDRDHPASDGLLSYLYVADVRLSEYLDKLKSFLKLERPSHSQRTDCGKTLEQIADLAFQGLQGVTRFKSFQSAGAQYDLLISGDNEKWLVICDRFYLSFDKRDIIIEAKAKESKVADQDFARLCSIMDLNLTNTGLGIFFTLEGATGFPDRTASKRQRKISDCRLRQALFRAKTGKYIIVFDKEDIFELNSNGSLMKLIIRKIRDLEELSGIHHSPAEEWIENKDLPEHLKILHDEST